MKVVVVLPYLKAGGTERQASYIANHLQDKGHEVTVIAIEKNNTLEAIFDVPITFLNSKNSYIRLIPNLYLLVKKIKQLNPDVVVSRAWSANVITSIVSWFSGKPWVLFLSGSADLSKVGSLKRKIHMYCIRNAAKIISVSEGAKQNCMKWLSINKNHIRVVHNGVDINKVQKLAEEKSILPVNLNQEYLNVLFVGRLIDRKGVDLIISAAEKIIRSGIKLNFIIVGKGEQEQEYKDLAKKLNIESYVFFVGQKTNPFPYMANSDIFVLPSRSEGFPNVLLEAMALGMPVVASDCDTGPREIIAGQNGFLINTDDYLSLADKIIQFYNDNEMRITQGINAQNTVREKFQLKNQLDLIEDELKVVVSDNI